jgi:hypothetical protein
MIAMIGMSSYKMFCAGVNLPYPEINHGSFVAAVYTMSTDKYESAGIQ